ncbi:MAG: hypothetical protein NWE83_07875 [Candidatus Bathyarchaeota archaeon]|nr:hypothetical protein [Candidatus Bathyarchaeota archaeon]
MNRTLFFIVIFVALFVGVALDQATGNLLFGTVIVVAAVIMVEIFYRKADDEK